MNVHIMYCILKLSPELYIHVHMYAHDCFGEKGRSDRIIPPNTLSQLYIVYVRTSHP